MLIVTDNQSLGENLTAALQRLRIIPTWVQSMHQANQNMHYAASSRLPHRLMVLDIACRRRGSDAAQTGRRLDACVLVNGYAATTPIIIVGAQLTDTDLREIHCNAGSYTDVKALAEQAYCTQTKFVTVTGR